MKGSPVVLAGLAVSAIALVLQLVGISTKHWVSFAVEFNHIDVSSNFGLWIGCLCFPYCVCKPTEDHYDDYNATKACAIIALMGITATMVLIIIQWCARDDKVIIVAQAVIAALSALFTFIGAIVFAAWRDNLLTDIDRQFADEFKLGYSFALCVVSGLLMCIVVVLSIFQLIRGRRGNLNG